MHFATLLATLAVAFFTVEATPTGQEERQVVLAEEQNSHSLAECTIPFHSESKEEDPFEAAIRHKLSNKEDFDLKDEKHDEYEEGGVKGKTYHYRAASGRFH
ncbi:hypothetical protein JCM11251_004164 [Rhodosporidiobolus azoricus]